MKPRLLFAAAVVAAVILAAAAPRAATREGSAAPSITMTDANGVTVTLAELKGKVVLVDFWASWCVPCRASFPALEMLYRDYKARGFEVLAVNVDERRKDADQFLKDKPHTMRILFDPKGQAPEAFGVTGMPTSVLIDRKGVIRYSHQGYTDKTLDNYRFEIGTLLQDK